MINFFKKLFKLKKERSFAFKKGVDLGATTPKVEKDHKMVSTTNENIVIHEMAGDYCNTCGKHRDECEMNNE